MDDLTFKLAQAQRHRPPGDPPAALLGEVFDVVLHASLRISQLNRARASRVVGYGWQRQMSSQMRG